MAASVAVLGAGGLMGRKMALRLSQQGYPVHAWNRTPLESLEGCKTCGTAQDAVTQAAVIITMLADGAAVRDVLEQVKQALKGRVVLMMSTIAPSESKALAQMVGENGGAYIEAPVLGSLPEVEKGTLQIMVGCDQGVLESHPDALAVLRTLGGEPRVLGTVGSASAVKLALNQLIITETLGFCASLGLVQKSGADVDTFMDILRSSALYAPTFDKKMPKYLSRDFGTANFPTKHLLKDCRLFASEAENVGIATPMQRAAEQLIAETCTRVQQRPGQEASSGSGSSQLKLSDADYSSVYEAVVHPGEGPAKQ